MKKKLQTWQGTRHQIVIGLLFATLVVAVIEGTTDFDEDCGWSFLADRVSHSSHGGEHRIRMGWGRCRIDVALEGEIDFTPDNRGVERVSPGASLQIKEKNRRERRRLDIKAGSNGQPEYSWFKNGLRREFDDEGRAWLAQMLPRIYRRTGLGAEQRVADLWRDSGLAGVLEETRELSTDYVRGLYLRQAFKHCTEDNDLAETIRFARREISSEHELGRTLAALETRHLGGPAVLDAWVEAVRSIDSDYQLRKTVAEVVDRDGVGVEIWDAALLAAASISSDHEQSQALIAVARKYPAGNALPDTYLKALETIGSDHEHRRVLEAAFARPGISAAEIEALLGTTARISSDGELSAALREVARIHSGPLRPAFHAAAEKIDSDHEMRRVLSAALARRDLDRESAGALLRVARRINSEYELRSFLVELVEEYPRSAELPSEFGRLAETIDSKYERELVFEAAADRGLVVAEPDAEPSPEVPPTRAPQPEAPQPEAPPTPEAPDDLDHSRL